MILTDKLAGSCSSKQQMVINWHKLTNGTCFVSIVNTLLIVTLMGIKDV